MRIAKEAIWYFQLLLALLSTYSVISLSLLSGKTVVLVVVIFVHACD
jgi:hypothetical protein